MYRRGSWDLTDWRLLTVRQIHSKKEKTSSRCQWSVAYVNNRQTNLQNSERMPFSGISQPVSVRWAPTLWQAHHWKFTESFRDHIFWKKIFCFSLNNAKQKLPCIDYSTIMVTIDNCGLFINYSAGDHNKLQIIYLLINISESEF